MPSLTHCRRWKPASIPLPTIHPGSQVQDICRSVKCPRLPHCIIRNGVASSVCRKDARRHKALRRLDGCIPIPAGAWCRASGVRKDDLRWFFMSATVSWSASRQCSRSLEYHRAAFCRHGQRDAEREGHSPRWDAGKTREMKRLLMDAEEDLEPPPMRRYKVRSPHHVPAGVFLIETRQNRAESVPMDEISGLLQSLDREAGMVRSTCKAMTVIRAIPSTASCAASFAM